MSLPVRRLQGAILLAGAGVFYLLLDRADIGFHWVPFVLGAAYLVAALVGGPKGAYWSTAIALVVFGLAPIARYEYMADYSAASLDVVACGLAVLLAVQMEKRGFAIGGTAVGATLLALGVVFAEQTHYDVVEEPLLYTGLLALVGLVRLVRG